MLMAGGGRRLAVFWLSVAPAAPAAIEPAQAPLPTSVTPLSEGAPALFVDPALVWAGRGLEATVRRVGRADRPGFGAGAFSGVVPVGPVAASMGYERASAFGAGPSRLSVGLSAALGGTWRLGWQLRHVRQAPGVHAWSNDVAVAALPSRYWRASVGLDGLNAPRLAGGALQVPRTLRAGVAVRPIAGSERLTVAIDGRLDVSAAAQPRLRALIMTPLGSGLDGYVGGHIGAGHAAFVGVRAAWGPVDVELAGAPYSAHGSDTAGARLFGGVRVMQHAPRPRIGPRARRISVALSGDLRAVPSWPWQRPPAPVPLAVRLHELARLNTVDELVLELDTVTVGLATVQELTAAVAALKDAGITVTARLVYADARTYILAAACSRITMDPVGQLDLAGFVSSKWFWADALARLGIRFEAVYAGAYKTGADGLTHGGPRPEEGANREPVITAAIDALHAALRDGRHLDDASAQAALTQGLLGAEAAARLHLIDDIAPHIDVERGAVARLPAAAALAAPVPSRAWGPSPVIAVVPVVGVMGEGPVWQVTNHDTVDIAAVERALADAHRRPEVRGVVLRIDSPGGDVYAAERLWRAVRHVAADKPVIASLGDVAASGGYYVAVAADQIVADAATITGSIGVYRLVLDASGLIGKLDVHRDARTAGPWADWDSPFAPLSEGARTRLSASVQDSYGHFLQRVAAGRHLSLARAKALGEGRVWLGARAQRDGLVDRIGGLNDAIEDLCAQLHLRRERVALEVSAVGRSAWADTLGMVTPAGGAGATAPSTPAWARWQHGWSAPPPLALYVPGR